MQPAEPQEGPVRVETGQGSPVDAEVNALMRATARRAAWFFIGSIVFALTVGATLGAFLWLSLTLQTNLLGNLSVFHARSAHGYGQVFGFTALFVCGVAYHVLPRLSGRPWRASSLQRIALIASVVGAGLGSVGMLIAAGGWVILLAHFALVVGAAAFAWSVRLQLRGSSVQPGLLSVYVQIGCWWLVAAAGLPVLVPALRDQAPPLVWEAALWGFAANWIYGMSLRILPAALGLVRLEGRGGPVVCTVHQLGVLLWCVGMAAGSGWLPSEVAWLSRPGALLLVIAALGFAYGVGFFRPRATLAHPMPGTEKFLWTAYLWLAIALAFGPLTVAVTGAAFVGPVADFARHAFTLGFLTQMIFGVSMRVLPAAAGIPIWSDRLRDYTYGLLNAGAFLRAGETATAWGGSTAWYQWSALSGPVAWAAFLLFAVNLTMSVRQGSVKADRG